MREYNKYDKMIFLLIVTLVAGDFGGALQIPRALAIVFSPLLFNCLNKSGHLFGSIIKWCSIFILYSGVSIIWTPAGLTEGLIGFIYNVVHILLFWEFIVFSRHANNVLRVIPTAFLIAFLISAVIAFWELTTGHHLAFSKFDEAIVANTGHEIYIRNFAAVTFTNLNTYVTYICLILPYLFYGIVINEDFAFKKNVYIAAVLVAIILVLYNGSRGGLLACLLMSTIFYIKKPNTKGSHLTFIVIMCVFGYILYEYRETILLTLTMRMETTSLTDGNSRYIIWNNVMKVIKEYFGMGCGTAGLIYAMEKYAQGGITVAHNLLLEIWSQYGIIFAIAFCLFFIKCFKETRYINDKKRQTCVYISILSFPIIAIINSTYIAMPIIWVAMASLYIFANYERIRSID